MEVAATVNMTPLDIRYLLFLQNFRNSINDALTPFMEGISLFAVTYLIMIPVLIYWMLNKKSGLYTLASYYLACGVNAVVKLTACIYRPWIRDPRVIPAGDAITTATGYSFPSGHTITGTPIYGGIAVISRKRAVWVSVLAIAALLTTGFSRNYLGVHTPQDVCVAMLEGILWLYIMARLFKYLEENPEKENLFLLLSFVFGWLAIIYITFKSYPMEYVGDKLLVDPKRMMIDGYGDIALMISFPVARYVEKRWIRFRETGVNVKGIVINAVGMVILWVLLTYLKAPMDDLLGKNWGHFVNTSVIVFYCIALFPMVIRLCSGGESDQVR